MNGLRCLPPGVAVGRNDNGCGCSPFQPCRRLMPDLFLRVPVTVIFFLAAFSSTSWAEVSWSAEGSETLYRPRRDLLQRSHGYVPPSGLQSCSIHPHLEATGHLLGGVTGWIQVPSSLPSSRESSGPAPGPSTSNVPDPVAFFPFDGSLSTYLYGNYSGATSGGSFVFDYNYESYVLLCSRDQQSTVVLDDVPYGTRGPFAINLWMRAGNITGDQLQYLYSHNSSATDGDVNSLAWGPNQVQLYFPEPGHIAFGVLRGVVKDATDAYVGDASVTFLDSDGQVSNSEGGRPVKQTPNVTDGEWHMLTLTTPSGGGKGYQMYIDGGLVAEMSPGSNNLQRSVDGGDPMYIDGKINLCARSNMMADRFYDGRIAQLSIFDSSLSPGEVRQIYLAGQVSSPDSAQASSPVSGPTTSVLPDYASLDYDSSRRIASPAAAPTTPAISPDATSVQPLPASGSDAGPTPVAFFPLTGRSLSSLPIPRQRNYSGLSSNVVWTFDDDIGDFVVQCNKVNDSAVVLEPVAYGQSGPFAINLWFKVNSVLGDAFQYLYSHTISNAMGSGWDANQVRLYFPEMGHPAFGVVRSIVKDSTDIDRGSASIVFVDSDGQIGSTTRNSTSPALEAGQTVLQDGSWHMATITTLPGGVTGYSLYIDGYLAGTINGNNSYIGPGGTQYHVDGGNPMNLNGSIYLCGRSLGDQSRGYDGRLASLGLYNTYLTGDQIAALYDSGPSSYPAVKPGAGYVIGDLSACPLTADIAATLPSCENNQYCIPVSAADITSNNSTLPSGATQGRVGVCVDKPQFPLMLPDPSVVSPPLAFFPLTGTLSSYPIPKYSGIAFDVNTSPDPLFGVVNNCTRDTDSIILLEAVPYAARGRFSVNFWMRSTDASGMQLQYVYSHEGNMSLSQSLDPWGPNQIQVYFPGDDHPAAGVVRTFVHDNLDVNTGVNSQAFLDSDGRVADNTARPSAAQARPRPGDGNWHMVSVTSQPDGGRGYRLYLDGVFKSEVSERAQYQGDNGIAYLTTGGRAMALDGPITLCTRADNTTNRYFDGSIAYLGLYDYPLSPSQVASLYSTVRSFNGTVGTSRPTQAALSPSPGSSGLGGAPAPAIAAGGGVAERYTINGNKCALPAALDNGVLVDCTPVNGTLQCPIASSPGVWEQSSTFWDRSVSGSAPAYVTVAQRNTTDGESCQLPLVIGDSLLVDCVFLNGTSQCRGESSQEWKNCSTNAFAPRPLNETLLTNPKNPPREGQLCRVYPGSPVPCSNGLLCVPLPENVIAAGLLENTTAGNPLGLGVCVAPGAAANFQLLQAPFAMIDRGNVPPPLAFFPLAGRSLTALGLPRYTGARSASGFWVPDAQFGQVFFCNKDRREYIRLQAVPFAEEGPWTLNFWFRSEGTNNVTGLSYILSTVGSAGTISPMDENQIEVYLPGKQHPSHGVIRTIVKDSTDFPLSNNESYVYLDSDGNVSSNKNRSVKVQPDDGNWHMVTLTTHTDGSKGYALYVDGTLAGNLTAQSRNNATGNLAQVGGGRPINLGRIYLCTRADLDPDRFFNGSIAHLSLYDQAFSTQNVSFLYTAYATAVPTAALSAPPGSPAGVQGSSQVQAQPVESSSSDGSGLSAGAIIGIVAGSLAGAAMLTLVIITLIGAARKRQVKAFRKYTNDAFSPSGGDLHTVPSGTLEMQHVPFATYMTDRKPPPLRLPSVRESGNRRNGSAMTFDPVDLSSEPQGNKAIGRAEDAIPDSTYMSGLSAVTDASIASYPTTPASSLRAPSTVYNDAGSHTGTGNASGSTTTGPPSPDDFEVTSARSGRTGRRTTRLVFPPSDRG
eukprot:jgi/Botrbrau1/2427/Bobra.0395s0049.1